MIARFVCLLHFPLSLKLVSNKHFHTHTYHMIHVFHILMHNLYFWVDHLHIYSLLPAKPAKSAFLISLSFQARC